MKILDLFGKIVMYARKGWTFLRWFLVAIIKGFFWVTAKFMPILLYPVKEWVTFNRVPFLWYYFDAEVGYYGDRKGSFRRDIERKWKLLYRIVGEGAFWDFWVYYIWNGWRNPAWNAQTKLAPRNYMTEQRLISYNGELYQWIKDPKGIDYDVNLYKTAGAKQCDAEGRYEAHGEFISPYISIWGSLFIWFWNVRPDGKKNLHWRYSFFNGKWEIQFGTSDDFHSPSRYIHKIKYKRQKMLW